MTVEQLREQFNKQHDQFEMDALKREYLWLGYLIAYCEMGMIEEDE